MADEIIASCPDHQAAGSDARLVVTQESDNTGHYFRYNGTKLGAILEDDTDNTDYDKGSTNMVVYGNSTYIATKGSLIRLSGSDTWSVSHQEEALGGEFNHPLLVFENSLYIGDGNELKRITSDGGASSVVLTLPTNEIITALGIDRGTGKILIASRSGPQSGNVSNTLTTTNSLSWYDGFSNKVSKYVRVDDQILSFHNVGNVTYVGYGQNVGFISGSGVRFLRKLRNVDLAVDELPYKDNFANIGSTLYVVDNHVVMAYGEILPGRKVWWPVFEAPSNTRIDAIMPLGSNKLGVSYATKNFISLDVTDTDTIGTLRLVTNKYTFPRPIQIQSIYMEYITAIANNSTTGRTLNIFFAHEGYNTSNTLSREGESSLHNTSGSTLYEMYPVLGVADKTWGFQLEYIQDTTNWGFRRMLVYYNFIE